MIHPGHRRNHHALTHHMPFFQRKGSCTTIIADFTQFEQDSLLRPAFEWAAQKNTNDFTQNVRANSFQVIF
jgi:hypothetical protein